MSRVKCTVHGLEFDDTTHNRFVHFTDHDDMNCEFQPVYRVGDRVRFTDDAVRRGRCGTASWRDVGTVTEVRRNDSLTIKFPTSTAYTSTSLVEHVSSEVSA